MPKPICLYDTAARAVTDLQPLRDGVVSVYTCGPTVYGEPTIGNWRTFVFEDVLVRTLRRFGYEVRRVMNVTDVGHLVSDGDEGEDKMEVGARRDGLTAWDVAKKYEQAFVDDLEKLRLEKPALVRATDRIQAQIDLIKTLEEKGFTYRLDDGIYYDSGKFPDYGKMARLDLEGLRAGARVEVRAGKKHPTDFALWKFSPPTVHRDMEWDSPWGKGFPGWHIECSAIIRSELGDQIDIHCGGADHIPVHHTNEIAQSEAVTGKPLAQRWMHADFLMVDGGKISKSLGNGYTVVDLERRGIEPLAFKLFTYGAHYRSKQNFTWEAAQAAQNQLERLRRLVREGQGSETDAEPYVRRLDEALADDLNVPVAVAALQEGLARLDAGGRQYLAETADQVLALDLAGAEEEAPAAIRALAAERERYRGEGNWAEADRLREQIRQAGWSVEDKTTGSELHKL